MLIQKDVKRRKYMIESFIGLRALLIQKDVKRKTIQQFKRYCLRALLIQKDVKLFFFYCNTAIV